MKRGIVAFIAFFTVFVAGVSLALADFQLQTITLHPQDAPLSCNETVTGQMYYVSSTDQVMVCNGTANVPLVTGTNYWSLSGSNLYPSSTGYNVGIGLTSPSVTLDVNGNIRARSGVYQMGSDGTAQMYRSGNDVYFVAPSGKYYFYGAGIPQFYTLTSTGFGIGTANPSTAGLVVAAAVSGVGIDVQNNRIQNVGTPIDNADAVTKSYVDSSIVSGVSGGIAGTTGYLAKFTGTNTVGNSAIYQSGTLVGIGKTNPGAALDVNGNLRLGGNSSENYIAFSGTAGDNQTPYTLSYIGERVYGGTEQSELLLFKGNDYALSSGPDRIRLVGANILFDTYNSATGYPTDLNAAAAYGTTRMLIDQNGHVGINTTSPGTNLDVNGNIQSAIYYDRDNTNYYLDLAANTLPYAMNAGGNININGLVNTPAVPAGGVYGIQTGGSYALTFQGNQDCAANAFLFQNAYSVKGDCSGNAQAFKWETTHATFGSRGIGFSYGTGSSNGITFYADSVATTQGSTFTPTARMIINNAGSVGIGTTNPSTAGLVVTKNISSIGIDVSNNRIQNVGTPINAADATTKSYVDSIVATGIASATSSQYWTLSGSNLYPDSTSYNVGIGTTNPGAKLTTVSSIGTATGGEQYGNYFSTTYNVADTGLKQGLRLNTYTANTSGNVSDLMGVLSLVSSNGSGGSTTNASSYWSRIDVGAGHSLTNAYNFNVNNGVISGTLQNQYGLYVGALSGAANNYAVYTAGTTPSYFGGKVGINTTSPGTNLDVNGNIQSSIYYDRDNTNYYIDAAANTMPYSANLAGGVNFNGKLTTPALTTGAQPVYIRGTGLNHSANRLVQIGGTTVVNSTGRGLNLLIITAATQAVVSNTTYDTYGDSVAADNLATALNNLTRDQIGVLTSWDAIEGHITANLQAAARRLGLYKLAGMPLTGSRRPYAAIFYGSGTATANTQPSNQAVEVAQSSDAGAPYALIATWLTQDGFVGQDLSNALVSGDPMATSPALFVDSSGNVGIGTTAPDVRLNVTGGDVKITNGNLTFTGSGAQITGVSKLTVTSIDPLYTIGGVKYATYVPDVIGYKVEAFGKIELSLPSTGGAREAVLDFRKAESGSDLWLFWQTIAEGDGMKDVSVYLTPQFDGRAWYTIDPAAKQIVIYGEPSEVPPSTQPHRQAGSGAPVVSDLEVSYHLVAPRHDTSLWPNVASTTDTGTVLPLKISR